MYQAKRVFEFCKEMGTDTLVSEEPPTETFDLLEKLCGEYQINLAIHNHQRGKSLYWQPEQVLAELKRQGYRGLTTIDYEYDTPALQDDVRRYVKFVGDRARELGG